MLIKWLHYLMSCIVVVFSAAYQHWLMPACITLDAMFIICSAFVYIHTLHTPCYCYINVSFCFFMYAMSYAKWV